MTPSQPLSGSTDRRSRLRIAKKRNHRHSSHPPRCARRVRRNSSSNRAFTYTTSAFSLCHLSRVHHQQHPRSRPPPAISSRFKSLYSMLRRHIHLLKFNLLLRFGHLRAWLLAKFRVQKPGQCLRMHNIFRSTKPENTNSEQSRRPFFSKDPSHYDTLRQRQRAATTARKGGGDSAGHSERGEEKKRTGRARRISQSTVKSLKKVCGLECKRSDLMEEDRRAMERLDELWRSREDNHV